MKELEITMVKDLINVYQSYFEKGLTDEVKKNAKEIESKYLNSSPIVRSDLTNAKGKLTYFYADIPPGPISKIEAKKIVLNLEKLKHKLENDNS
ncbi:hypothetical protein GYA25_00190 [Candidatus Woesearchaeota archaeon]|nr:hypothetical protein [Candidatus Woesearchaeota archaeon]